MQTAAASETGTATDTCTGAASELAPGAGLTPNSGLATGTCLARDTPTAVGVATELCATAGLTASAALPTQTTTSLAASANAYPAETAAGLTPKAAAHLTTKTTASLAAEATTDTETGLNAEPDGFAQPGTAAHPGAGLPAATDPDAAAAVNETAVVGRERSSRRRKPKLVGHRLLQTRHRIATVDRQAGHCRGRHRRHLFGRHPCQSRVTHRLLGGGNKCPGRILVPEEIEDVVDQRGHLEAPFDGSR
ncbi:hypothetical protein AWB95_18100 [Mycobacterium celatum]|uniref:Uncharacterized protein n=1 Tax=Mycobacterium celatum TaxID=28045 RepID=A0A1X1RLV1_MYCCE|nr:hypothetical protein AWB95_18100 [Mycobacterium celatum]PIB79800.1 hypothetical protein CQY23_05890 [Mycobacterium celatum]